MTETIGNPLSWSAREIGAGGRHIGSVAGRVCHGDADAGEIPGVGRTVVAEPRR